MSLPTPQDLKRAALDALLVLGGTLRGQDRVRRLGNVLHRIAEAWIEDECLLIPLEEAGRELGFPSRNTNPNEWRDHLRQLLIEHTNCAISATNSQR